MSSLSVPSLAISLLTLIEDLFKRTVVRLLRLFVRSSKYQHRFDRNNVRNILVVRQHDQLGDMLCTVPLFCALRENFPSARITLVASPVSYSIMLHHPYVDLVLNYDKTRLLTSLRELYRYFRKTSFDLAIVPTTVSVSLTSNIMALLSRAAWRIGPESLNGIANTSSYCFSAPVVLDWRSDGRRHQARRNLDILTSLTLTTDDLSSVLGLWEEEKKEAIQFVLTYRKKYSLLVGFHPGAGKIPNRWNADRFASVANRLHKEFNAGIVITSGPMDREPVAEMLSHLTCEYLLVERQSIRNVAAILDTLDLYVTNDTGTMHIAGAVSTSVLALFGPTDPLQWAPLNQKNHYIAAKDGDMNLILEGEVFDMASLMLQQSKHL